MIYVITQVPRVGPPNKAVYGVYDSDDFAKLDGMIHRCVIQEITIGIPWTIQSFEDWNHYMADKPV